MQNKVQTCPYLDLGDVRCAEHFTLGQLAEAYRLCFGNPGGCPVHALLQEEPSCQRCDTGLQEARAA